MTDSGPPKLDQISQSSGFNVPTMSNIDNDSVQDTKGSLYDSQVGTIPLSLSFGMCANTSVAVPRAARVISLTLGLDAQSAANTIQNHPATQSVKDTIGNGPVADHVKDQHAKTSSEFRNLADARTTPAQSTATGQPLTRKPNKLLRIYPSTLTVRTDYHSFFYNLLSVCQCSSLVTQQRTLD